MLLFKAEGTPAPHQRLAVNTRLRTTDSSLSQLSFHLTREIYQESNTPGERDPPAVLFHPVAFILAARGSFRKAPIAPPAGRAPMLCRRASYMAKDLEVDGQRVRFSIWDTGARPRGCPLPPPPGGGGAVCGPSTPVHTARNQSLWKPPPFFNISKSPIEGESINKT